MHTQTHRSSILTRLVVGSALALAAAAALGGIADAAAPTEQVTVQSSRIENVRHLGRTSSGIPIDEISLSVAVKTEGLDLGTSAGFVALEKRIQAAADSACRQISRDYPFAETSDAECAIAAARPAIARVRELVIRMPA
jgi:UrcA family protein